MNTIIIEKNNELIAKAKQSVGQVQKIAIAQAWEILQLATASVVQVLENYAKELSGKEKKQIAMDLLNTFYDNVFTLVKIPFVPPFLDAIIHKQVKGLLMIMVGSSIDAIVKIFKDTGVFLKEGVK